MTEIRHWHVATGLAGYGPDGSDGFDTATDIRGLTEAIREELSRAIDFNAEGADAAGDIGDYKEAWEAHKLAESLDALRMNLDYDRRALAPLYVNDPATLDESMLRIIAESFPMTITGSHTRLYAWECDVSNPAVCEHVEVDQRQYVADALRHYLETALWASVDDCPHGPDAQGYERDHGQGEESCPNGEPLDTFYDVDDIDESAQREAEADVAAFVSANWRTLRRMLLSGVADAERTGHDFWLTRNGHGAGFRDQGYPDGIGEELSDAARAYGGADLYVGDDGKVYAQ